ncbi:MAG: efflux RND transporter permease subunit [Bacteroidales bacterium]|nr:efflux RND transporter permease subunit [Bacteroidales bacterium]
MSDRKQNRFSFFEKSSYGILMAFIALMVAGLALLPFLKTGLEPKRVTNDISISYNWYNAAPLTLESEVTSVLAEVCSTLPGIQTISTFSQTNSGGITIEFLEEKNMDAARMEVSSVLRRVRPKLPDGLKDLKLSGGTLFGESERILSYSVFSTLPEDEMEYFIEEQIKRPIALVEGVNDVEVSGLNRSRWEVCCDYDLLHAVGLNMDDVYQAIQDSYGDAYLGSARSLSPSQEGSLLIPVYLQTGAEMLELDQITLRTREGDIVRLKDLAEISKKTVYDFSAFRINGLSTLRVSVLSDKDANILQVGKAAEKVISQLRSNLPAGYSIRKELDTTEKLKEELRNIYLRTALSFFILLIFISLVSRAPRYIFAIFFSLLSTLAISVVFFYLFKIQINLYSLAGITVSFGIIIDNIIVMQDHLLLRKDMKGFPALLAATLTTLGALSVIFLLDEEVKLKLGGFASVFAVTLTVSLFTALFLVPALTHLIKLSKHKRFRTGRRDLLARWFRFLGRSWSFFRLRNKWIALFLILGFGIPVFNLPDEVGSDLSGEEHQWYHQWYNKTIGSDFYADKLKKVIDISLGGTLRLFLEKKEVGYFYYSRSGKEARESRIGIYGKMEMGSSKELTDKVTSDLESFLSTLDEIDIYTTNIIGSNINISIEFKEPYQFDYSALIIKNEVVQKCILLGGASWRVIGYGDVFEGDRPFSNDVLGAIGYQDSKIEMKGYDLGQLYELAGWLADRLRENGRFQDITISSRIDNRTPLEFSYQLEPRKDVMQYSGVTSSEVLNRLSNLSSQGVSMNLFTGKSYEEINISSTKARSQDIWNLMNSSEVLNDKLVSVGGLLEQSFQKSNQTIRKEDGQYLMSVLYNFVGPNQLHWRIRDQILEEIKEQQPLGYSSAPTIYQWGGWRSDNEIEGQLKLFIIIVLIIYFICAILLNSLVKPLVVIFMIPVSFIGLFITFSVVDLRFDNGIFAAFIFTSGLTVNSALYIINEFNSLKKMRPDALPMDLYVAAFRHKIMPIKYTIVSTVLGLIPFILINRDQEFWYSFAVGTIAGCVFSLVGVFVFLPAFLRIETSKVR